MQTPTPIYLACIYLACISYPSHFVPESLRTNVESYAYGVLGYDCWNQPLCIACLMTKYRILVNTP